MVSFISYTLRQDCSPIQALAAPLRGQVRPQALIAKLM